jgi:hypothetical protein
MEIEAVRSTRILGTIEPPTSHQPTGKHRTNTNTMTNQRTVDPRTKTGEAIEPRTKTGEAIEPRTKTRESLPIPSSR